MRTRVHVPALITLLLLSPVAAELLSGSAPPMEFFTPFALLFLVFWYGVGAILCRELSIRWGSGLVGLFLLGATFGVVEEGILVKTFFDPHALDLGVFQIFGWWAGANWPWILMLTLYHAVVSISLPVLVVHSLWPGEREQPWLSKKFIAVLLGLMALLASFGWFVLSPAGEEPAYVPGLGQFLGALAAAAGLALLARRIKPGPTPVTLVRRWPLFLAGLGWGFWTLGGWIVSETTRSTGWTMLYTGLAAAILLIFAYRRLRAGDRSALIGAGTFAAGTWLFWSLLAFIQEMDNANRPDDTSGMALVGLASLVALVAYLIYLGRSWRSLKMESPAP